MSEIITESKKNWKPGQSAAISTKNKTILVSAAAGSGKTATLTERIIRSITNKDDPADISKMLIVTFTRAAAAELKDRIFKAISNELYLDPSNGHLNDQLIKLVSANICTIDSFYLNIIRQNFSTLGISASFRIAESSELDILKKTVMDEVIDDFYDNEENFDSLAECFIGTRSIGKLAEPLITLSDDLASFPEGTEYLKIKADELIAIANSGKDFFLTPYGKILANEYISQFSYYAMILGDAIQYSNKYDSAFSKRAATYINDQKIICSILEAFEKEKGYMQLRALFNSADFERLGYAKPAEETEESIFFKTIRKKIIEETRNIRDRVFSRVPSEISLEMKETAYYVSKLYNVLSEYDKRMKEEKTRRNIMDFDDIRRNTLKLLLNPDGTPTSIALSYREQFTDIYIDEYQDVDRVQDMIFSVISNNNRFMVGDIKQSIYGFRGAEPQVFADYKKNFKLFDPSKEALPNSNEITIFMSNNFRCDKNIIDFTNLICSRMFRASADSIGYTPEDDLKFSKDPPYDLYRSPLVKISVINSSTISDDDDDTDKKKKRRRKKDSDTPSAEELEAEYIATEIERLIKSERKADGSPIIPGDIAVLYRSNKMVAFLSDALIKRGILSSESGGNEYFESPDVLLVLSVLNVIDNPHRDVHLAATLCSPVYEFTFDELICLRLNAPSECSLYDAVSIYAEKNDDLGRKCADFISKLDELRRISLLLPVDRFLRVLFESEEFISSGLLCERTDFGEGGNLLRLYDYARSFEAGSFKGLYNFIEFLNELIENDQVLENSPKGRSADRVNLSTMHHSKGLEFPVCFICGVGKRKNTQGLAKSLLYNKSGIAIKLPDTTGFARINTPLREAVSKSISLSENEEEMRILYVAMTRARERLYITATTKQDKETLMNDATARVLYKHPFPILHATSYLQWILLPFADKNDDTSCCEFNFIEWDAKTSEEPIKKDNAPTDARSTEIDEELYRLLKQKFSFEYKYKELMRIPAKLSVSRLSPDILDDTESSQDLIKSQKTQVVPDFFLTDKPQKASASERGTATHLFLQFCDIERCRKLGVNEEISRLIEQKFIPENVSQLLFTDELNAFSRSELADRFMSAKEIIREQRFNLLLNAAPFTKDENFVSLLDGETLAVQGVIDLILINENGDIELYDYKTDRLTHSELSDYALAKKTLNEKHAMQLSYYAYAVSRLFGKECSKVQIYSTHSAKLYDVDLIPLKITQIER